MPWHVLACPSTPCYELDKGLMKGAMVLLDIEPLMYLCTPEPTLCILILGRTHTSFKEH